MTVVSSRFFKSVLLSVKFAQMNVHFSSWMVWKGFVFESWVKLGEGGEFLDAGLTDACQVSIFAFSVFNFTSFLYQFNKMIIFFFQKYHWKYTIAWTHKLISSFKKISWFFSGLWLVPKIFQSLFSNSPTHELGKFQEQIQFGWRLYWQQPWGKRFGGVGWPETCHEPAGYAGIPERQLCPGLHPKQCGQQGERCGFHPLFYSHIRHMDCCPALATPQKKNMDLLEWVQGRAGPRSYSERWSTFPMKTRWKSWDCPSWTREVSRETLEHLPVPEGSLQKGWRGTIHKGM